MEMQLARKALKKARIKCDGFKKGIKQVVANGWNPENNLDLLDQMKEAMNNFMECSDDVIVLHDDDEESEKKDIDARDKAMVENWRSLNEFKEFRSKFGKYRCDVTSANKNKNAVVDINKDVKPNSVKLEHDEYTQTVIENNESKNNYSEPESMEPKFEVEDHNSNAKIEVKVKQGFVQCSSCLEYYSLKWKYKHRAKCNDKQIIKCETCNAEFIGKFRYRNHKSSHKICECEHCGVSFKYNSKSLHKILCSAKQNVEMFTCDLCPYETKYPRHITRHELSIHSNANEEKLLHKCKQCHKIFKWKSALIAHSESHLKKELKPIKMLSPCHICSKSFNYKYNLNKHMKRKHRKKEMKPIKMLSSCHICSKSFNFKYSLNRHMKRCTEEKLERKRPIKQCDKCEYSSNRIHNLKKHKERKHIRKKNCDNCDYISQNPSGLERHIKKCSEGIEKKKIIEKKENCDNCEFYSVRPSDMRKHIIRCQRKLERERIKKEKHICKVCGKTFKSRESIRVHEKNHVTNERKLPKEPERPLQCKMCQNFFKTKDFLDTHMENHFEFEQTFDKLSQTSEKKTVLLANEAGWGE